MQYGTVLTWGLFMYSGLCLQMIMQMQYGIRRVDALLNGPGEIPASKLARVARA